MLCPTPLAGNKAGLGFRGSARLPGRVNASWAYVQASQGSQGFAIHSGVAEGHTGDKLVQN